MILLIMFALGVAFLLYRLLILKENISIPSGLKETPLENGLVLIGIISQAKPNLAQYLMSLGKKHGSIFRVMVGMREVLILNNFEVIKRALKEDGDNFSGRYSLKFIHILSRSSGILFTDGEKWAEQRSFVLKVLRDFGFGKSKALEIVQNECCFLLNELETFNDQSVDFTNFISTYTTNIISKFIMDKRFPRGDSKLELPIKRIADYIKSKDYLHLIFMMFPFINNSHFLSNLILKMTSESEMFDEAHEIFKKEIDEHLEKLDLNSEGEDLIDRFLIKQHQMKESTGDVRTFTNWQLIRNAIELFIAGYETTSTTLGWAFMFMSRFPEIQNKVYQEIIDEIGQERMPTMNDKKSLNYTQAVMDEIMRMSSVVPMAITHRTFVDASVNGYFIPRNSFVIPNLYACHHDPEIWENPMEFKPNRFLSTDYEGKLKYSPKEELIPLGIGKRQCLGESLARMEYFIFLTSIIQKFNVSFIEDVTDEKYQEILIGKDGFLRFSLKTDFMFKKRQL